MKYAKLINFLCYTLYIAGAVNQSCRYLKFIDNIDTWNKLIELDNILKHKEKLDKASVDKANEEFKIAERKMKEKLKQATEAREAASWSYKPSKTFLACDCKLDFNVKSQDDDNTIIIKVNEL
jgi:hypothetical protein